MSLLSDPVAWAEKSVGTYPRFLFVMFGSVVFAVLGVVFAFGEPSLSIVPVGILAGTGINLAVSLRQVLLRLKALERDAEQGT